MPYKVLQSHCMSRH